MLPLDRCLAFLAVAQTILATLRATSRTLELGNDQVESGGNTLIAPLGVIMEGPLILPPGFARKVEGKQKKKKNETAATLWDLVLAFRQGVRLSLDRDNFDVEYGIDSSHLEREKIVSGAYFAVSRYTIKEEDGPDEEITMTLKSSKGRALARRKEGCSHVRTFLTTRTSQHISSGEIRRMMETARDDEDLERGADIRSPMETDFFVTLTTDCVIGSQRDPKLEFPPRDVRVTAYAPDCFAELRSFYGIGESQFRRSILESGPYVSFHSNSKGSARVGGFFFFTRDGAFMIKTIKKDEVEALLDMLPRYYRYMKRNGRRSLLTRFCGMFDVVLSDPRAESASSHTFVVMNAVFPPEGSRIISERFDLKGSTLGREVSIDERESKGANAVLKDLDLAREVELLRTLQQRGGRIIPSYGIDLGPNAKAIFMAQVRRDVQFLVDCQVIDYSLLVGVAKESQSMSDADLRIMDQMEGRLQQRRTMEPNLLSSVISGIFLPFRFLLSPSLPLGSKFATTALPGHCVVDAGPLSQLLGRRLGSRAVYYFGLIDFLQPYNTKKAIEYRLKSVLYKQGAFSCVPPKEYADRFLNYLDRHII
jgi:hypothetical protein